MQGTRDSIVAEEDHALMIIEVNRCSDATKGEGDPDCKPRKLMKLADGSSPNTVSYEKLKSDGANLDLYIEDLTADSIDNFVRNKKVAMKIINQKIVYHIIIFMIQLI